MKYLVVTRARGPAWDDSKPMREQERWAEHATFMNGLAEEGFVVLGGPLGDGSTILLVFNADSEGAVKARLEADPWTPMGLLRIARIEPWEVLLGDSR